MAAPAPISTVAHRELINIADAVAQEKGIEREIVIEALESAIQNAGKKKYGNNLDIRASIDRRNGNVMLERVVTVVDTCDSESAGTQISLEDARRNDRSLQLGDIVREPLPPVEFGRISAQQAKQVIVQKVREAERQRQYDEFKDRCGEIINGTVKRSERGNHIIDLSGRAEGLLRREDSLPREPLQRTDRVRAYLYDVRLESRGTQILLSRVHPQFMAKLFTQEVPEIYDGLIEIKAVARDPGSRAKIAVLSSDDSIDPVGACVGIRGSRVQAVVNELGGEKIDIIPWSPDTATFVVNALQPAEVTKVVMDEAEKRMEVVVPDSQLSLAIGRRGQNVRLASQLVGWDIDIMTETDESNRRTEDLRLLSEHFMNALDVDDVLARLLVTEGFEDAEEVAYVEFDELTSIEGFDETLADALRERALAYVERHNAELDQQRRELGVADAIAEIEELTPALLVELGARGILTLDDLAELSNDELLQDYLPGTYLTMDDASRIIMAARRHWYKDDEATESTPVGTDAETEQE